MPTVDLHGYWRSSATYRVRIALALKRVPFTTVPVNILRGEQNDATYKANAPSAYVPTLYIDGAPFFESVAILELLDELFPEPRLLPATPIERAHVRAMVETINAGVQPLQNLNVLTRVGALSDTSDSTARAAWASHYVSKGLASLEAQIAQHDAALGHAGPFAFGSAPTLADVMIVPQLYASRRFDVDLAQFPRVVRAGAALAAYPGVDAAAPERQPDAVVSPP